MVVQDFPAVKLFMLLLKQISKPITDYIKHKAIDHPLFRSYVCMPPAYFYNWCDVKMKMRLMDLGKPIKVPQLNETMAIDLGAQILGEGLIFLTAASLVCFEYSRQMRNEDKKEEMSKEELYKLHFKIQELKYQLDQQTTKLQSIHYTIHEIDRRQPDSIVTVDHQSKRQLTENISNVQKQEVMSGSLVAADQPTKIQVQENKTQEVEKQETGSVILSSTNPNNVSTGFRWSSFFRKN